MITNYLSKAVQAYRDWRKKAVLQGILSDGQPVFTSFGRSLTIFCYAVFNCFNAIIICDFKV